MIAEAPGLPLVAAFQMTWPPGPYSTRLPSPCRISWYWPCGEEMDWLAVRTQVGVGVGDGVGVGVGGAWATRIASTKAVLSPPALSRPLKAIVCAPAVTVNAAVVSGWYDVPDGVKVPTTAPSTSTSKSCRDAWKLPRCAAS